MQPRKFQLGFRNFFSSSEWSQTQTGVQRDKESPFSQVFKTELDAVKVIFVAGSNFKVGSALNMPVGPGNFQG